MTKIIIGTNALLDAAYRLALRGEISWRDYNLMKLRNEKLENDKRNTVIEIGVDA